METEQCEEEEEEYKEMDDVTGTKCDHVGMLEVGCERYK